MERQEMHTILLHKPTGRPRTIWENNIEIHLREMGFEVNGNHLGLYPMTG
jgi:hypothetical protein